MLLLVGTVLPKSGEKTESVRVICKRNAMKKRHVVCLPSSRNFAGCVAGRPRCECHNESTRELAPRPSWGEKLLPAVAVNQHRLLLDKSCWLIELVPCGGCYVVGSAEIPRRSQFSTGGSSERYPGQYTTLEGVAFAALEVDDSINCITAPVTLIARTLPL